MMTLIEILRSVMLLLGVSLIVSALLCLQGVYPGILADIANREQPVTNNLKLLSKVFLAGVILIYIAIYGPQLMLRL